MRFYNDNNDIKIYSVAGTQTVLLPFDILESKLDNDFLGFSVERIDEIKLGLQPT